MDKNEILEKSKAEFNGGDPYFEEVQNRYMRRGLLVVIVLTTFFYLAEMLVRREMNLGFLAIVCINAAALNWALYKRKPERWRRSCSRSRDISCPSSFCENREAAMTNTGMLTARRAGRGRAA